MTHRQRVAAFALLAAAYLPVWATAAMLAWWAIWHLFWMAVVIAIMALVGIGALVEIAAGWVARLY